MEIFEDNGVPTGTGYNDWRMGHFETRLDYVIDQYHAAKSDTLKELGKYYCNEIVQGNYGAYMIADDPEYPYYVIEWVEEPWCAKKDDRIKIGTESFIVHKGDWICKGVWLTKLYGGRN